MEGRAGQRPWEHRGWCSHPGAVEGTPVLVMPRTRPILEEAALGGGARPWKEAQQLRPSRGCWVLLSYRITFMVLLPPSPRHFPDPKPQPPTHHHLCPAALRPRGTAAAAPQGYAVRTEPTLGSSQEDTCAHVCRDDPRPWPGPQHICEPHSTPLRRAWPPAPPGPDGT